jgi:hypothetical protein
MTSEHDDVTGAGVAALRETVASLWAIVSEALSIAEREGHFSTAQQLRAMIHDAGLQPPTPGTDC